MPNMHEIRVSLESKVWQKMGRMRQAAGKTEAEFLTEVINKAYEAFEEMQAEEE